MRPTFVRAVGEQRLACGLYANELDVLSRYNAERSRGIVHDAEWVESMGVLQARFDAAQPYTTRLRPPSTRLPLPADG